METIRFFRRVNECIESDGFRTSLHGNKTVLISKEKMILNVSGDPGVLSLSHLFLQLLASNIDSGVERDV